MAKSALEKQLDKMQREEKQRQRANELRERAATIIAGQPLRNGMRIMDETAEIVLECLLNMRKEPDQTEISYQYDDFPENIRNSLALELEKLIQYGMLSSASNWITGGEATLLPPAFTYFEKKRGIVETGEKRIMNNKVFIVHGHDVAVKQEVARTLEKAGFEAIILHEQADGGDTIIEKIERYTDVDFAVVLYTECDYGRAKEEAVSSEKYRARQNVVFEHGYLMGKLGRRKVCALVKGDIETPSDITGVVYTPMDENGAWKVSLAKNMRDAGMQIDFNRWV